VRAVPSEPDRKKGLLRLVGRFILFLSIGAVVFPFVVPVYNRGVAAVAEATFRLVERPDLTSVRAEGATLWIDRATPDAPAGEPFTYFDPYLYFALVPLTALLLATPGLAWTRRIRRVLIGVVVLFALTVGYVVGSVEVTYVMVGLREVGRTAWRTLDWAQVLLRLLWEVAPVLVWAGLAVRDWRAFAPAHSGQNDQASGKASQPRKGLAAG